MSTMSVRVGIIGLGKVGKLIGLIFDHKFQAFDIRKIDGLKKYQFTLKHVVKNNQFIFIAVQDDSIPEAVDQIKKLRIPLKKKAFFHTSGSKPAEILKPLKKSGAKIGSMHPAISIIDRNWIVNNLKIFQWTIENPENIPRGIMCLLDKKRLNWIKINPESKIPYHIACTLFSNLPVFNPEFGLKLLRTLDFNSKTRKKIALGLISSFEHNLLTNQNEALTGPIARRDWGTVNKHLEYLERFPEIKKWLKKKTKTWVKEHK